MSRTAQKTTGPKSIPSKVQLPGRRVLHQSGETRMRADAKQIAESGLAVLLHR
jgi:hypothetical protein